MSSHPLVLSSISKSYAGVAALVEVSLTAKSGEVHALLGENGAGKSTLMNVASGTTPADSGTITVSGNVITHFNPHIATELGIAFVHQHPAVLPDLTVAENILISVPGSFLTKNGTQAQTMRTMLNDFGLTVDLKERVGSLTVAQKHLLELAKAFAIDPKVLILDEPTAPLGQESVDLLFDRVKKIKETGTAVIYITHRLAEVRMIADHVTVLRDGKWRGTSKVSEITDNEVLTLIVGRNLDSTFPNKHSKTTAEKVFLNVENLSGEDFNDVSISSNKGEIIGIAGVNGNGQSELLRALAGLNEFNGNVAIGGESFGHGDLLTRTAYLPADRHGEALMMSLSVRENAAVNALKKFKKVFLISRKKETTLVLDSLTSLSVKAPSMDAAVSSLSGGNQQKIVISRALLSEPVMIIADEPTQGVDVGARAEIYQILRNAAEGGIPVIVASSDAKELEGLCDRVYVMSRGHVIQTLVGPEITETKMIDAAVRATTLKKQESAAAEAKSSSSKLMRFIKGDFVPPIILSIIMIGLGIYIQSTNNRYFSNFNISSMLLLVSALGFIAMGQTIVLLVGGMDLSIGPMAGFLLVVASFFVNDGRKPLVMAFAFVLIFIVAAVLGSLNGILIRYGKFTAVAATLTGYIGIQGASFLLRESPDGYINASVAGAIAKTVGPIPLSFVGLAIVAVVLEVTLRRSQWGMRLRAVGSSEESARRLGVNVNLTVIGAYVASALFAGVGAIMLMAELGVGDPAQGPSFTLQSITAVVLGGTSLLGGRGSFVGTLFGSMLMIQVLNACLFLSLSQSWQYIFQGTLVIGAAIIYTKTRSSKRR